VSPNRFALHDNNQTVLECTRPCTCLVAEQSETYTYLLTVQRTIMRAGDVSWGGVQWCREA
jgi:hypothetical protein